MMCLLVCGVPTVAEKEICGWERRELSGVVESEIGKMAFLKNIQVLDSPIQVNRLYPDSDVTNLLRSERSSEPQRFAKGTSGSECKGELLGDGWDNERGIFVYHWNDCDLSETPDVERRCESTVFYKHANTRDIGFSRLGWNQHISFEYSGVLWQDISSQLALANTGNHDYSAHQSNKLEKCNNACNDGYLVAKAPRISWIAWSFFTVGAGFFLCLFGGQYFDNEGRLLGAALLICGLLLGALGFLIWWPTYSRLWRWTWGQIL